MLSLNERFSSLSTGASPLQEMAKMQQAGPRTLAQIDWQHPESLDGRRKKCSEL